MHQNQPYLIFVSDREWQAVARLIPLARVGGRQRSTDLRKVFSGILYKQQHRCPWRALPAAYPPWQTVRHYFDHWQRTGVWSQLVIALRQARGEWQINLP